MYVEFLKNICFTKRKLKDDEVVSLGKIFSTILQRKFPPKCKDAGSFSIPCTIRTIRFERAMLDLGALINVILYSIYDSHNIGPLKGTSVIIQLAYMSIAYPKSLL